MLLGAGTNVVPYPDVLRRGEDSIEVHDPDHQLLVNQAAWSAL